MGAQLFHADRLIYGHDEANSCFPQFANVPKKERTVKYMALCGGKRKIVQHVLQMK
jgi:hypothetical protein